MSILWRQFIDGLYLLWENKIFWGILHYAYEGIIFWLFLAINALIIYLVWAVRVAQEDALMDSNLFIKVLKLKDFLQGRFYNMLSSILGFYICLLADMIVLTSG